MTKLTQKVFSTDVAKYILKIDVSKWFSIQIISGYKKINKNLNKKIF